MHVAVIGSRDFPDMDRVREFVNSLEDGTVIVSGGARGVDRVAETAARARNLECVIFPADWETHGRGAGYIRNKQIIDAADRVVAFWDGVSKGTKHSMGVAESLGKPLEVHFPGSLKGA